jgi:threonine dehydratase
MSWATQGPISDYGADLVISGDRYADALAALISHRYQPAPNERVAVLICGANTTAVKFDS